VNDVREAVTATRRFTPGTVCYDGQHADGYSAARALSAATVDAWREAARRHLPALPGSALLDVGSGTGRFSPLLVEWFSSSVVGVEPSPSGTRWTFSYSSGTNGSSPNRQPAPRARTFSKMKIASVAE
jgi:hypothetical protein